MEYCLQYTHVTFTVEMYGFFYHQYAVDVGLV